jgi:hypothetical protein
MTSQPDLFLDPIDARLPRAPKAKRVRRSVRHGWSIVDHVCRNCLGRVLSRDNGNSKDFICADCGTVGAGNVTSVCTCGSKFNTGRDIGIRCMSNPAINPTSPTQIVSGEPR